MTTKASTGHRTRGKRWGVGLAISVLMGLAAAAHVGVHYWPRVRASQASAELWQLWSAAEATEALWLAQPHQNLAALEQRVGNLDRYLADLAVALGSEPVGLPRFGPFRFPPAREMVVARVVEPPIWRGAAQIYPGVALAARGAGKLTGNPWLGGGSIDGETRISWQGNLWRFGDLRGTPGKSWQGNAVTGRLRLDKQIGYWPAGDYDLLVATGDVWLLPHGVSPSSGKSFGRSGQELTERLPLVVREHEQEGQRVLAFLDEGDGGIPGVVSIARGLERWPLPGERLLSRLGMEMEEESFGDWSLAAYSREDLDRARQQLATIVDDAPSVRFEESSLFVRIEAGPVSRMAVGLAQTLEQIPIIGPQKAAYWWSLSRTLAALGERGFVEGRTGAEPRMRIHAN